MSANVEQIVVTTPDMSCEHCVASIESNVRELAGVQSVKADLSTQKVTIAFDPSRVDRAKIESTLDDAGYPVAE